LGAGYVVTLRSSAVLLRHRAEAAADLAALAAAGQFGTTGSPCGRAAEIARRNDATVVECHASPDPGGRSGDVRVVVAITGSLAVVGSVRAVAHARAARLAVSR
jgi:secretion/DNA translocation related TadE-like protein